MTLPPAEGLFSQPYRVQLIDEYFADREVVAAEAWKDVYRLLLWVDAQTGIAHCYESDKSQPGKPWYPRSLIFHDWLATQFGVDPLDLKEHIDLMFQRVIGQVLASEAGEQVAAAQATQIKLFDVADRLPSPGDDPRLEAILTDLMPAGVQLDEATATDAIRRVYAHMRSGNKRANLLGRGFEDVLSGIIARLPKPPERFGTQRALHDIDGFRSPKEGDKIEKVDLWVSDRPRQRTVVTAKWSVRADREKQFKDEFGIYIEANEWRDPFEYIWATNEFDPARLVKNATELSGNQLILDRVVHICPEALWVVHGLDSPKGKNPQKLRSLLEEGRIIGLADWLEGLVGA